MSSSAVRTRERDVSVASLDRVPTGSFLVIDVEGVEIGLTRSKDRVYAVRNVCPHQGAPICRGRVGGTMMPASPDQLVFGLDGLVVRCPWHAWEFNLENGQAICGIDRGRVRTYPTEVRDGNVFIRLSSRPYPSP